MTEKRFALVDCNSFYASCEKIFRPDLADKPVIVLSNNDGCVVALSKEAKKLGIKRAVPLFEIQDIVDKNSVKVFSSNYELYGDISRRIMNILKIFSPGIEVYSIDEAFLDLTDINESSLAGYIKDIQNAIAKGIKIPVSIGVGPTKTLAKLANKIGKDNNNGLFNITRHPDINKIFKYYGVHEIWGVGFQYTKMLHKHNIFTIYDFINLDDAWVKKKMTSRGLLTLWELRGRHCIDLAETIPSKKQIISSRSFGKPVSTLDDLKESAAFHINTASRKLREQNSLCTTIIVYIATNEFKKESPQYSNSAAYSFTVPTDYTPDMINKAHAVLANIFKDGYQYKKAGVMLTELVYKKNRQPGLFEDKIKSAKKEKLLEVIDIINKHGNYDIIRPSSYTPHNSWQMKRIYKSPDYTTNWLDLPLIKAD